MWVLYLMRNSRRSPLGGAQKEKHIPRHGDSNLGITSCRGTRLASHDRHDCTAGNGLLSKRVCEKIIHQYINKNSSIGGVLLLYGVWLAFGVSPTERVSQHFACELGSEELEALFYFFQSFITWAQEALAIEKYIEPRPKPDWSPTEHLVARHVAVH